MNNVERLRTVIRNFEDRKVGAAQLGRAVLHTAHELVGTGDENLRRALVRLGNRLNALAERSLHDDVQDEVRASVDDLHAEINS